MNRLFTQEYSNSTNDKYDALTLLNYNIYHYIINNFNNDYFRDKNFFLIDYANYCNILKKEKIEKSNIEKKDKNMLNTSEIECVKNIYNIMFSSIKKSINKPFFIIIDSMIMQNKLQDNFLIKYSTNTMHYKFQYFNPNILNFYINCYQNLPSNNYLYQNFHEFDDYALLLIYKWLSTISNNVIVITNDKYKSHYKDYPEFFIPIDKIYNNIKDIQDHKEETQNIQKPIMINKSHGIRYIV